MGDHRRTARRPRPRRWPPRCASRPGGVPGEPAPASSSPPSAADRAPSAPASCPVRARITSAISSALPRAGAERLAHVRHERGGGAARRRRRGDEGAGERAGLLAGLHEGAGAELHVEHEAIEPLGELLRQDRGGDEIEAFHRAGHVAHGVEPRSAGATRAEAATMAAPARATVSAQALGVEIDPEPRDRLQLVERAAGMAEPAPRDHRHVDAAGRQRGREDEAHAVAHAAGGVLVEHRAVEIPAQHVAAVAHRERQRRARGLGQRHAADAHGEGAGLRVAHPPVRQRLCRPGERLARGRLAAAERESSARASIQPRSMWSAPKAPGRSAPTVVVVSTPEVVASVTGCRARRIRRASAGSRRRA